MALAVEDVDAVLGASRCGNSRRALRRPAPRSPRARPGTACGRASAAGRDGSRAAGAVAARAANRMRRATSCSSTVRTRVRADMHGQHVADAELRADAGQHRRDAGAVGVGQFGQIAGAHQDFDVRPAPARLDEAAERRAKPKWIGSSTGSAMKAMPARLGGLDGAPERIEIAGRSTGSAPASRSCSNASGSVFSSRLSRKSAPARSPSASSSRSAESTLTEKPRALQRAHRLPEMRKRRVRQAAEVDDVGAGGAQRLRPREDRVDRQHRRSTISAKMRMSWRRQIGRLRRRGRERPAGRRSRPGRARTARRNARTAVRGRRGSGRAG